MESESRKYITPKILGITKRHIEPPNGGWKERSYYVVEYARTSGCLVKKGIFYTGEIYDNEPMAYNALGVFTYEDYIIRLQELYYCKALTFIYSREDWIKT